MGLSKINVSVIKERFRKIFAEYVMKGYSGEKVFLYFDEALKQFKKEYADQENS